ncbi:MAG TPA: putative peptidoglycan glycosyltransferase FtsW [Candidatus Sulfotelmatobacter sp.]|nr:putative peptidoglycan glycosyltransferase FtsW [Candidatus Sulfotelmatobacter sp.]
MRPGYLSGGRRSPSRDFKLELGRKHKPDHWLLIWCAVLLTIGLVVIYAISPALAETYNVSNDYYVFKQIIAIALSLVAFYIAYRVPLQYWKKAYKPLLIVAGLATALALALPVNPSYPAHRWVRLGTFSFQSVELVKFAGLIWLAGFLATRIRAGQIKDFNATIKPLLYIILGMGIVVAFIQSDLGSAGVIVAMVGTMAYVAGVPLKRMFMILGIVLIGAILAISISPYRRARLETYLHPQSNCQGSSYQACQALIAVGSGGVDGLGLGSSVQAYGYLPEAANDSIFAIYAEKFGFIGSVLLLAVYMALFTRMKNIAERTSDDFSKLIVIGVLTWISIQTLVNVGAMIGIFPLKGITLPFISYGGTSVVFTTAALGLVFQVSQYTSFQPGRDVKIEDDKPRDFRSNTLRRANY